MALYQHHHQQPTNERTKVRTNNRQRTFKQTLRSLQSQKTDIDTLLCSTPTLLCVEQTRCACSLTHTDIDAHVSCRWSLHGSHGYGTHPVWNTEKDSHTHSHSYNSCHTSSKPNEQRMKAWSVIVCVSVFAIHIHTHTHTHSLSHGAQVTYAPLNEFRRHCANVAPSCCHHLHVTTTATVASQTMQIISKLLFLRLLAFVLNCLKTTAKKLWN